jgi:hypothetical protein
MDSVAQILASKEPLLAALLLIVPLMGLVIYHLYKENQMLWLKFSELQAARQAVLEKVLLEAKHRD